MLAKRNKQTKSLKKKDLALAHLISLLEETASKCNIDIRYDQMKPSTLEGGICKVNGKQTIVLNKLLSSQQKTLLLASFFRELPLSEIFLPPLVREFIENPKDIIDRTLASQKNHHSLTSHK